MLSGALGNEFGDSERRRVVCVSIRLQGRAARGGGWMVMFAQAFRLQPHGAHSNEVGRR